MELFLECQGMAIECRTGSKPALYRCCEALLFVADWRFWCLAAALFLHLWLLLPYSPVFLSVVMPPVFFFFPSRDLLFFVTAYYSASPSTLPHPHPLDVLAPSCQLLLPIWWLVAHSLNSSLFWLLGMMTHALRFLSTLPFYFLSLSFHTFIIGIDLWFEEKVGDIILRSRAYNFIFVFLAAPHLWNWVHGGEIP